MEAVFHSPGLFNVSGKLSVIHFLAILGDNLCVLLTSVLHNLQKKKRILSSCSAVCWLCKTMQTFLESVDEINLTCDPSNESH